MKSKTKKEKMSQLVAQSNTDLIQSIQHPKKKLFIEHYYATDGNVSFCTQAVQINRSTFYEWLKTDPIFAQLINEQRQQLLDDMDKRLRERAKGEKGTTELIFWLKTHHQDYKENREQIAFKNDQMQFVLTRG